MSALEQEQPDGLCVFERRVYQINELPPEIAERIQSSKMNAVHDHLDVLVEKI